MNHLRVVLQRVALVSAAVCITAAVPTAAVAATAGHATPVVVARTSASHVTPDWCWAGGIECGRSPL